MEDEFFVHLNLFRNAELILCGIISDINNEGSVKSLLFDTQLLQHRTEKAIKPQKFKITNITLQWVLRLNKFMLSQSRLLWFHLGRVHTKTIVNAYFYLHPHEDDHHLRSVFKLIHFGVRFRIYAFTVSVFIVFVWTEGLNA